MLSPVSSRAPQSQTLYAQQVPIDAGKVTEVYLDAMSHIFIKVVVMNDMNIGSYKSNTEYWYAATTVAVADAPQITMGSQSDRYDANQIQQFIGSLPLAFTWTQNIGKTAWTQGTYMPVAPQAKLFKAPDPDDASRQIALLIEQDASNNLRGITWYKQVNTGLACNVMPGSLKLTQVTYRRGMPSVDPSNIAPGPWYYAHGGA